MYLSTDLTPMIILSNGSWIALVTKWVRNLCNHTVQEYCKNLLFTVPSYPFFSFYD